MAKSSKKKHFDILTGQCFEEPGAAAGKVSDPPDMRGEAGFESLARQAPADAQEKLWDELMRSSSGVLETVRRIDPDEALHREYPNVGNSIPDLLRAILRELVILRVHR